ncbi:3-oxoacyl-ACP reductase FabG [Leifsonia bigeumensis]|uniref:3-oxoacyl-ACP reductase FabG n=1 Tax=Leifsonella bigeumensis TaxID=433643 RepID=A0ABP7F6Q7_9MICO
MNTHKRVAIVTGAARGIGAAIARRLSDDGVAIAVVDRDGAGAATTSELLVSAGGEARAFTLDVTDSAGVAELVDDVAATLGAPTILVNNAGVIRDNSLFKMSDDDWDVVMNVHLKGAFLMSRAIQSHMVAAGWGRIVNLSSSSALGNRGQANYSAAKAGIQGFTKTLALELGRFGITANAIAPGFIQTDMTAATAERLGISFEQFISQSAEQIPVRRVGQPQDVAETAAFFCSDAAGFVSGQVLYVAGGPLA